MSDTNAANGAETPPQDEQPIRAMIPPVAPSWNSQEQQHRANERRYWCLSNLLTLLAVIGASLSAFFAWGAVTASQKAADAAEKQLSLSYPPRLRIINPAVFPKGKETKPVVLIATQDLVGEIQVILSGRDGITIQEIVCMPYWTEKPLPMGSRRPYLEQDHPSCERPRLVANLTKETPFNSIIPNRGFEMLPGQVIQWGFSTTVPADYEERKQTLYIIGYIAFSDRITLNRYSLFAYRYDTSKERFVRVSNPDYEREDEQFLDALPP